MTGSRLATDAELEQWRTEGWVVLEGLVDVEEIDRAREDLWELYPTPEEFFGDPDGDKVQIFRSGGKPYLRRVPTTPAMDAVISQFVGVRPFPFPESRALNRLAVHRSIVDFVERALGTDDLRLYQAQAWAKYHGDASYEQDHHVDLNHSWLAPSVHEPWGHVEGFLFLSDIDEGDGPTYVVSRSDSEGLDLDGDHTRERDPELYAKEHKATGVRGSFLAYRNDVFHRGSEMTKPGGSRFLFNLSYRRADHDWIGFHAWQSYGGQLNHFIEGSTVRELALLGFPAPGHPIWTEDLVERTARRYPGLDMTPWQEALPTVAAVL